MSKEAQLEAILYLAGDEGITEDQLSQLLDIPALQLHEIIKKTKDKLEDDHDCGLSILRVNDVIKLVTKNSCSDIVGKYFQKDLNKNLSQSALEVLSIVAYRQPITRIEIDDIRGVNSEGAIQTLIWRGLVEISGKKEVAGHPNLYVTTEYFLQYFGYQSLDDLPLIESFSDSVIDSQQVELFNNSDDI